MRLLGSILFNYFKPRKSGNDNVWDSTTEIAEGGSTIELTTSFVKYVNDGAGSYSFSNQAFWDSTNNIVDCSALPIGSKLDIKLTSDITNGNKDNAIEVEFRCPNNGSPFVVGEDYQLAKKASSYPEAFILLGYVGPEVQQYGIEIYSRKIETSTVTASNRKLLVRA